MNNKKPLTHAEYEERVKNIRNPEEALAFARDLLGPFLQRANYPRLESPAVAPDAARPLELLDVQPEAPRNDEAEFRETPPGPWQEVVSDGNEAKIISLYAKGMTTNGIASYMRTYHGMNMASSAVSAVTDKVYPLVREWQSRTLSSCYPIIYLDGMRFKVRDSGKISPRVAYIAMGVSQYGLKEVLGIWTAETEGAKFWMHALSDLKSRGVEDILIACVDGLKGFPEAIKAVFPNADVQICIAHQIRHTMMFLPHRDRKHFCEGLKEVYGASSEQAGREALAEMMERWPQYRAYLKSWENRWTDLAPFFEYPQPIRRMIYTTGPIENLNRQFRRLARNHGVFPHDEALAKTLWLSQAEITQNWTMAVRNWGEVLAQLNILFPDRIQF